MRKLKSELCWTIEPMDALWLSSQSVKSWVKKIKVKSITINHKRILWNCWFHKFDQINYECKSIFGRFGEANDRIKWFELRRKRMAFGFRHNWLVSNGRIIARISLLENVLRMGCFASISTFSFNFLPFKKLKKKFQIDQLINSLQEFVAVIFASRPNKWHWRTQRNLFGISLNTFQLSTQRNNPKLK